MSVSSSEHVSLVVSTMNRSAFLIRLLRYYAEMGFQGRLVIGDASDDDHAERSAEAVRALSGTLRVDLHRYPGLNEPETSRQLLALVTTPYVALLPDDDVIVPEPLAECAAFLGRHPDYSLAHGRAVMLMLQRSGSTGPVEAVWPHYWGEEHSGTGAQRLLNFLGPNYFTTLFSVHRTPQMRAIYQQRRAAPVLRDKVLTEVLAGCLSVIHGKVKRLDLLYVVRQHHNQRYLPSDFYDWLTGPEWFLAYDAFRDCLADELVKQDGLQIEDAREVVKRAFWPWLANRLMSRWRRYAGLDGQRVGRLREAARQVPGLKKAWRALRLLLPGAEGAISLLALLRPTSPYHGDFMPVYQAVTEAGSSPHRAETAQDLVAASQAVV